VNFINTKTLMTAAVTIGLLAVAMRVPAARDAIMGESKFLGIF